nr:MAG TPA: hypothetical protein [Bacteriophage sp.]
MLTQNNSKLVQSILPKLLTILAARPLPLLTCNTQITPKQCSSTSHPKFNFFTFDISIILIQSKIP